MLSGLLTGIVHIPYAEFGPIENPDLPLPFGSEMAWLAVESTATREVARTVGLKGAREATWEEGVKAAYLSSVFVTPPLGDWTLIASTGLFPTDRVEALVKPILDRLSRKFADAQYFCSQQKVGLHVWARGKKGVLVRGFGWLGQSSTTLWNEGAITREERTLGYQFSDGQFSVVGPTETEKITTPNEECVMQLASLWSINPTTLDEHFKEPLPGLLGAVTWGAR